LVELFSVELGKGFAPLRRIAKWKQKSNIHRVLLLTCFICFP
jgi:hypothetical protein